MNTHHLNCGAMQPYGGALWDGRTRGPGAAKYTPTAARLYQWAMETSQVQRRRSLAELRRLHRDHGDHVRIICTHDPALLEANRTEQTITHQSSPGTGG